MSKSIRGAILPIVAGIVALAAAAILVIVFMVHPETKVAPPSQAMQPRAEDRQAGGVSPEAMASLRDIIQAHRRDGRHSARPGSLRAGDQGELRQRAQIQGHHGRTGRDLSHSALGMSSSDIIHQPSIFIG